MVEEEWLQLKIKFLLGYNMKIFTERGRGNEPLLGESTDGVHGRSTRYWTSQESVRCQELSVGKTFINAVLWVSDAMIFSFSGLSDWLKKKSFLCVIYTSNIYFHMYYNEAEHHFYLMGFFISDIDVCWMKLTSVQLFCWYYQIFWWGFCW